MSNWQPKKGDRVMVSDETWEMESAGSRRVGRRGGTVVGVSMAYQEMTIRVLWDGLKLPVHCFPDSLMPYDPTKHELPPHQVRDNNKSAYSRTQVAKFRRRMREKGALTEELARKLNRALDAMERGDFNDPE